MNCSNSPIRSTPGLFQGPKHDTVRRLESIVVIACMGIACASFMSCDCPAVWKFEKGNRLSFGSSNNSWVLCWGWTCSWILSCRLFGGSRSFLSCCWFFHDRWLRISTRRFRLEDQFLGNYMLHIA